MQMVEEPLGLEMLDQPAEGGRIEDGRGQRPPTVSGRHRTRFCLLQQPVLAIARSKFTDDGQGRGSDRRTGRQAIKAAAILASRQALKGEQFAARPVSALSWPL
ncbi:hypothetical protein FRZ44_27500 [Hypericibacter terrae]|uniref:Uncharacterized protein n=1 Tax=Hypericibacter terrae TaxID=2602015 RepID=A0A5J6MMN0_9PROT|nr:hypothetical protein FRZ44_27500 [Hypericibacter terrae]